ncbi:uncharacterized protein LOC125080004 [Lutra lutra]|uniref:uncharacterized protein LOC125080004 n=1 Tax=Lutra lutra TaxID=9657 RepID=UPI001FD32CCC|nr:uncharacterized protein LOC125080004 [Lutra lutra]
MGLEESELSREEIGEQWGLREDSGADICQRSQGSEVAAQVKVGPSEGPDGGNRKDFLTQTVEKVLGVGDLQLHLRTELVPVSGPGQRTKGDSSGMSRAGLSEGVAVIRWRWVFETHWMKFRQEACHLTPLPASPRPGLPCLRSAASMVQPLAAFLLPLPSSLLLQLLCIGSVLPRPGSPGAEVAKKRSEQHLPVLESRQDAFHRQQGGSGCPCCPGFCPPLCPSGLWPGMAGPLLGPGGGLGSPGGAHWAKPEKQPLELDPRN